MKSFKILAAGLTAAIAASVASADTVITITGSTAFRSATIGRITALFDGTKYDYANSATSGSSTTTAFATFIGVPNPSLPLSITGNGKLIVQCSWTGSVEGIRDVVTASTQPFIKSSEVTGTYGDTTITVTNVNTNIANASAYESVIPQMAMSDNRQAATIYNSVTLTENQVGVVPFVWVKVKANDFANLSGAPTSGATALANYNAVTNITSTAIRKILGGGFVPMSYLTGNATEAEYYVQAVGRTPLSGTRVITFAESGFGATSDSVSQIQTTDDGSVITALAAYPQLTSAYVAGNNGYTGSSDLVTAIKWPLTSATTNADLGVTGQTGLVAYVGLSDAVTHLTNTGNAANTILTYNGVGVTWNGSVWNVDNVLNGKYPFWFYEYLSYRSTLSGAPLAYASALKDALLSVTQTSLSSTKALIKLDTMKVGRETEGGVIGDIVLP